MLLEKAMEGYILLVPDPGGSPTCDTMTLFTHCRKWPNSWVVKDTVVASWGFRICWDCWYGIPGMVDDRVRYYEYRKGV